MKGVGVVFDVSGFGSDFHVSTAWNIFMQNLRPEKIIGCTLRAGDPAATLSGSSREFCIAVYGDGLDIETVKGAFLGSSDKGLAALDRHCIRRFMSGPQLDSEHFKVVGAVDAAGKLVQDESSRVFSLHDCCKKNGWGFEPNKATGKVIEIPNNAFQSLLGTAPDKAAATAAPEPKAEAGSGQVKTGAAPGPKKKPWWKFWA